MVDSLVPPASIYPIVVRGLHCQQATTVDSSVPLTSIYPSGVYGLHCQQITLTVLLLLSSVSHWHHPSQLAVRVEASEATQGPDREGVAIAGVADGAGLVEHTADVFLRPVSIVQLSIKESLDPLFQN